MKIKEFRNIINENCELISLFDFVIYDNKKYLKLDELSNDIKEIYYNKSLKDYEIIEDEKIIKIWLRR